MASAEDIPYQLRPNKFIDRQIFIDLLTLTCARKGAQDYIYVSMGGKHLVDQESVYRRVGIKNLYSFDGSEWVVKRQEKNAPHDGVICESLHSSSLPGYVDILADVFEPASQFIFWLDHTNPSGRLQQLQELSQLLQKCQAGDVVRITMNSAKGTLSGDWEAGGFSSPASFRAHKLKDSLGEFFPANVTTVGSDEIAVILSQAVALAASQAENVSKLVYIPILLTTYADGQRMFTATILTMESGGNDVPEELKAWEFLPTNWTDIVDISAPDLSMKEKLLIDRCLTRSPTKIIEEIGFTLAKKAEDAERAVESYKRLHRYYPSFYAIGIQ